jgi:transcriptional regulator with XRE-family HTH domain
MTPQPAPLTPLESALAGVLRAERARLTLSLDDVVERSGGAISRVSFNRLEKGERHADLNQLEASARALGMPLSRLLELAAEQLESEQVAAPRTPVVTTSHVTVTVPPRPQAATSRRTTPESHGQDQP